VPAIKSLCERIDKNFFEVLVESPLVASYLLADLYRYKAVAQNEDSIRLRQTLRRLKSKLQPSHITLIWQTISNMTQADWEVLDPGTRKSLDFLKRSMLAQRTYLRSLPMDALLALGKKPDWYREVFIALVRKHLLLKKQNDPFVGSAFSFKLLRQGGAEQNFLYLSRYVAQCASLPILEIATLGSHDSKVAELILKDLTNSQGYFEVGAKFAQMHVSLRTVIAKQWQRYLETYPLSAKDAAFLQAELHHLQKRYPVFHKVILDNRHTRHYQTNPQSQPPIAAPVPARFHVMFMLPAPIAFIVWGMGRLRQHADEQIAQEQRMKL